jgi:hypothetical protein
VDYLALVVKASLLFDSDLEREGRSIKLFYKVVISPSSAVPV